MRLEARHLSTVGSIYEAALTPSKWSEALDQLAEHVDALGCGLTIVDNRFPECRLATTGNYITPDALADYNRVVAPGEATYWKAISALPPQAIICDTEFFPDRAVYDGLPMVQWGLKHLTIYHRAVARLNDNAAWMDGLAVQFREGRSPITNEERALLSLYLPHIAKAVEMQRPFRILQSRYRAILAALDHIEIGLIIVTDQRDIVLANAEARRIIGDRHGIWVDRAERLRCAEKQMPSLESAIAAACETAQSEGLRQPRHLSVSCRDGGSDLLLEVLPLRQTGDGTLGDFAGALAVVIDPENRRAVSTTGLRDLYRLTQTESEVCRLLLDGLTPDEIAEARGTAISTVRTHLKSVMSKTGCTRQSALVRLAVTIDPPVDVGGTPRQVLPRDPDYFAP